MAHELTKAILLEEAASEQAVAEALFASVVRGVPLVQALVESRAVSAGVLARYLARTEAPLLRHVVPLAEVVDRLPPDLCARLLAVPIRRDAITGTVDVVVADASDVHPGAEIAFHLGAPVRLVRAAPAAIEEALRRLRPHSSPRDDERMYDSRPRPSAAPLAPLRSEASIPPAPSLNFGMMPSPERPSHVIPDAHARMAPGPRRVVHHTPPWGTPVHNATTSNLGSEHPTSGLGSEIPIPLTRRTFSAVAGGTQRPPPLMNPAESAMGEGYPVDPAQLRQIVEVNERTRSWAERDERTDRGRAGAMPMAVGSVIPGPPPLPAGGSFGAYAPQIPLADIGGILAALRAASSRDEILELVLTGTRMVAHRVALFVVKRGGYLGWACTPEFADRAAVQAILIPLESASVLDEAVRSGLYLGPIRHDDVHASLLHVMRGATRDVAVVPIRVSGKTAVVVLADDLGDTMLATRRLEELALAAGDAFARIVRMRR